MISVVSDWIRVYRKVATVENLLPQVLDNEIIHLPMTKVSQEAPYMHVRPILFVAYVRFLKPN